MNRVILFRGKRRDNDEWVEGNYYESKISGCFILVPELKIRIKDGVVIGDDFKVYEVIPETIGQYIGLTDKNGKRIFEGDIVNLKTPSFHFKNCRIKYQTYYARYYAIDNHGYESPMSEVFEYEVIGNVHDNPELLNSD